MMDAEHRLDGKVSQGSVVGRKLRYRPEYCEKVIRLGRRGKSLRQIAAMMEVPVRILQGWAKENPDFSEALDTAKDYAQAWWEEAAQTGKAYRAIGASIWRTTVAKRFREDYGDPADLAAANARDDTPMPMRIEFHVSAPAGDVKITRADLSAVRVPEGAED